MQKTAQIYKNVGETLLEALERFRREQITLARHNPPDQNQIDQKVVTLWESVPMTYAGRLDPMAEGQLLILIGEECKNKERYLGLAKEYEVEVLFGIETDTYDALGIIKKVTNTAIFEWSTDVTKYVGTFSQSYPAYSSKTVDGIQLHELARAGELPDELPKKEVQIYSIEILGSVMISAAALKKQVLSSISLVKGDFRQDEIKVAWERVQGQFKVITLRVKCSSGTYMRSLAHRMGQDQGNGAIALTIKRTQLFM